MSFIELRQALIARLNEGSRGDRGWFLTTRVHLSPARLQQTATYLHDVGGTEELELTPQLYRDLAAMFEIETDNPAQVINRHLFLAMETPLRLLRKVEPNRWASILLTDAGVRLAIESNSVAIFEAILSELRFCCEPWYTASRVAKYAEFDVRPYPAILEVARRNGGHIDLDEFDLFVSRIRNEDEIRPASDAVATFRTLTAQQKQQLRDEVARRIPEGSGSDPLKPYNNWRDMARHTFSLFSLGLSAYRAGNELFIARMLAQGTARGPRDRAERTPGIRERARPAALSPVRRVPTALRIPDTGAPDELLNPPSIPQGNTGAESEILIGKILSAAGWKVVYYNQRRGYGFDLWAKKGQQAFVIEVKSALAAYANITLTALEYEAAEHHGENYLLVIVENAASDTPIIHVLQDPRASVRFTKQSAVQYTAARSAWEGAATQGFPEGEE